MKQFIMTRSTNGRIMDTMIHLESHGIYPVIVECENVKIPHINTLLTLQNIIKENIDEENILIFEDDVRLYSSFNADELISQNEIKFSVISTGSFSTGKIRKSGSDQIPYTTFFYGSQGVIYNRSVYNFFLGLKGDYIDTVCRFLPNVGITIPFLTYQVDYNSPNKDGHIINRANHFDRENGKLRMQLIKI